MVDILPVQPEEVALPETPEPIKEEPKKIWSKFSQGGPYFKYSILFLVTLVIVFLMLALAIALPYLTGGRYQNPISDSLNRALSGQDSTPVPAPPTPTPKPTPIPLKPDNGLKGTYIISQAKHDGPTFKQVVFDPLDVAQGQTFTITATLDAASAAQSMTGKLTTDNGSTTMTFQRISGNAVPQVWEAKINLNDSVLYNYILEITGILNDKPSMIIVAPRS